EGRPPRGPPIRAADGGEQRDEQPREDGEAGLEVRDGEARAGAPAAAPRHRVPERLQRPALQVRGERVDEGDGGEQRDAGAEEDEEEGAPAGGGDAARERQAGGDLGQRRAHRQPRLAEVVELEGARGAGGGGALDGGEDGADEGDDLRGGGQRTGR